VPQFAEASDGGFLRGFRVERFDARPRHVDFHPGSELEARLLELQVLFANDDGLAQDSQFGFSGLDGEILSREIGLEGEQLGLELEFRGFGRKSVAFDAAANASPKIDFPGGSDADAVARIFGRRDGEEKIVN